MNDSESPLANDPHCQLLRQLVATRSHSGEERAASEFLVSQFDSLGYDQAFIDGAGSAVGIRGKSDSPITVILLGHIDTVPGDIPVRIENDLLYGRGSVDAKGPLATFAVAGANCSLPEKGIRLIVAGAVEEESATSKGARQIARDYKADYCVIGEPSSSAGITLGYKGRILIDYEVEVEMGHTAGPERGAAEFASEFWQKILNDCLNHNQNHQRLFDQWLPSLRSINSSSDGLSSRASCKIGVRLPPDFDVEQFQQNLSEYQGPGAFRTYGFETAHQGNRSNLLCRSLASSIRSAELKPVYKLKTGTADMNVVAPLWKCPILAYGPGDSSLDHTPNEHLDLAEFKQSISILSNTLNQLFQTIQEKDPDD